jgi:hydroxyethylthiazole kinase-like uncharacterized protein yjeF
MATAERPPTDYSIPPAHLQSLAKRGDRHKHDYGHAIIVSGPAGQGGAARLAARGALRIGAGLVSVFASIDARAEHAAHLNAVMVKTYTDDRGFADQLDALSPSAVCIGPNFGTDGNARDKLYETLTTRSALCLDADALTLISRDPKQIERLSHPKVVMTPHEGELRRLIPEAFSQTSDRVALVRIAAKQMGCCVLYKGQDTLIARPDGACRVVHSGPSQNAAWLATAGTGDVLSGIITGLLARKFDAFDAAALGAQLHLHCAEIIGPGLIAEDLPDVLPKVLAQILQRETDH